MAATEEAADNCQGAGPSQWHADDNDGHCKRIQFFLEAEIQARSGGQQVRQANDGGQPLKLVGRLQGGPRQASYVELTKSCNA